MRRRVLPLRLLVLLPLLLVSLLTGCTGHITLGDQRWPTRAALLVTEVDEPERAWLLLGNSPMPCEPDTTENDPRTVSDEAASAREFWEAELLAALVREDAALLVVGLLGGPPYDAAPWPVRAGSLTPEGDRVARGAWSWVQEAAVSGRENLLTTYEVTEAVWDDAVPGGTVAWSGEEVTVTLEDGPTATGRPEVCDNPELASNLRVMVARLAVAMAPTPVVW